MKQLLFDSIKENLHIYFYNKRTWRLKHLEQNWLSDLSPELYVIIMTKPPGRGKKKGKIPISQGQTKELSSTKEDRTNLGEEENDEYREMTKGINLGRLSLTDLVCTDSYSLYERTSFRKHSEFNEAGKSFKTTLEKYNAADSNNKGQLKSSLPPLRQKRDSHKLLPFVTERHASEHSVFETKPGDYMENKREIIAPTLSESRKKLALSLSFVGIYDLDEMYAERIGKGKENKRLNTLKINQDQGFETLDESEGTSHKVSPVAAKFDKERTKTYVIKTLTLEDESPLSQQTLIQDKLILPEIKERTLPRARPDKIVYGEYKKMTDNRLPSIGRSKNKFSYKGSERPNRHRRKERLHDNSFERTYLETKIPQLPLLVNGRLT